MYTTDAGISAGHNHAARSTAAIQAACRAAILALSLTAATAVIAHAGGTSPTDDPYSNRGIKGSLSIGGIGPSETQKLEDGSLTTLRLGYGINDRVTLWGSVVGSELEWDDDSDRAGRNADLGGLEISVQYSIPTASRVRPFGRVGIGGYALEDRKSHDAWAGGGLNFGLGADYFLSEHWAIGAEMTYRGLDFTEGRIGKKGDFEELDQPLDGDAAGFALSVTVQ